MERDDTWSIFSGTDTFDSFRANFLRPIYLKPNVNDEIRKHVGLIEKLLNHCYYEYEFIDVALLHAIFTLEKAMVIRLNELNISFNKNKTLRNLSEWFFTNGYFEISNLDVIHQLRDIRNGKVHNTKKSFGGSVFLNKLYRALDLINDLYEDVQLRNERNSQLATVREKLHPLFGDGAILNANGERLIVHSTAFVFLNNKSQPPIFHQLIWPICDPKPYFEDKHPIPGYLAFKLKDIEMTDEYFKGIDVTTGKEVSLTKMDDKNRDKINEWHQTMNNLPDGFLIWNLDTFALNDHFYSALREFHQM
jgi:hypothetical protein